MEPSVLNIKHTHIRESTMHYLDARIINPNNAIKVSPAVTEDNTRNGWHIIVDKDVFLNTLAGETNPAIPYDLGCCILYAIDHDRTELIISNTGEIIPYMPRFKYMCRDEFLAPALECIYYGPALLACNIANNYVTLEMTPPQPIDNLESE